MNKFKKTKSLILLALMLTLICPLIVKAENKLEIHDISPKTVTVAGKEGVKISGKNFENIKVYLANKEIEGITVNGEKTEITLDLPASTETGVKEIKVVSQTLGEAKIEVKYVNQLTIKDKIEEVYILEKPLLEGEDYGKNNLFLIESFNVEESSIATNNLVLKLKSPEAISEDYFKNKINSLKLVRKSDNKTILVKKGKIIGKEDDLIGSENSAVKNATFQLEAGEVLIYLDEKALGELSYGSEFKKSENRQTAAGNYEVYLEIEGEFKRLKIQHIEDSENKKYDHLTIKDRPWVERTTPRADDTYYNPESMYKKFKDEDGKSEEGYYISVEYNNLGGLELVDKTGSHIGIKVEVLGDSNNIVDPEKKLRLENSTLYIPLKEKLESGQTYEVNIPESTYVEYPEYDSGNIGQDKKPFRNKSYTWRFGTRAVPVATEIFEGSVVENYDTNYPIILEGIEFRRETTVVFEDNKGDRYPADEERYKELEDGRKLLYVYLPRGRDRLRAGEYKILIRNGYDHESETDYGTFSVIKEGYEPPREEYTIKEDKFYGDIYSKNKESKDILELRRSDRNRSYLEIDLDEIMGEETWSRSLEYPIRYGDRIGELELLSKWGNINIKNLRLGYDNIENFIKLRVGRVSPALVGSLKNQLSNSSIHSDFIEVRGENVNFDSVRVKLPYKNYEGTDLELMRYDEFSRKFVVVPSQVDEVNRVVIGTSTLQGIFVVVHQEG